MLMINEINHTWTAEMKRKWRNDRHSECSLCNCVKESANVDASLLTECCNMSCFF